MMCHTMLQVSFDRSYEIGRYSKKTLKWQYLGIQKFYKAEKKLFLIYWQKGIDLCKILSLILNLKFWLFSVQKWVVPFSHNIWQMTRIINWKTVDLGLQNLTYLKSTLKSFWMVCCTMLKVTSVGSYEKHA